MLPETLATQDRWPTSAGISLSAWLPSLFSHSPPLAVCPSSSSSLFTTLAQRGAVLPSPRLSAAHKSRPDGRGMIVEPELNFTAFFA